MIFANIFFIIICYCCFVGYLLRTALIRFSFLLELVIILNILLFFSFCTIILTFCVSICAYKYVQVLFSMLEIKKRFFFVFHVLFECVYAPSESVSLWVWKQLFSSRCCYVEVNLFDYYSAFHFLSLSICVSHCIFSFVTSLFFYLSLFLPAVCLLPILLFVESRSIFTVRFVFPLCACVCAVCVYVFCRHFSLSASTRFFSFFNSSISLFRCVYSMRPPQNRIEKLWKISFFFLSLSTL